jgi:general secretion pathway protein D
MKNSLLACLTYCALAVPVTASSDTPAVESASAASAGSDAHDGGVPIASIIATVAKKTGKKYLIDPRVQAQVQLLGEDPKSITYPELITILEQSGFTAVELGGYVQVLPETAIRSLPMPLWNGKESYPDGQYVSRIIPVATLPAATLIPVLRPLLPQQAHLAAVICGNQILMVDTVANIRRIELIVKALDVGSPSGEVRQLLDLGSKDRVLLIDEQRHRLLVGVWGAVEQNTGLKESA